MPAKKKTVKKAVKRTVTRRSVAARSNPMLQLSGEVTTRTWALFVLFLVVSAVAYYRITHVGY